MSARASRVPGLRGDQPQGRRKTKAQEGKAVTKPWIIAIAAAGLAAACSDPQVILPGKRENLRAETAEAQVNQALPISLPATVANADWQQSHGTPAHRIAHPALSAAPALAWSRDIGAGDSRRGRITADPVVAGGRIFTLDAGAQLRAHDTAGQVLWSRDLTPANARPGQATGGGIAHEGGRVYVSSGFGVLAALDAQTGAVIWEQRLDATGSGTPTVAGDLVYLVTGDSRGWAVEKSNGRIRWQLDGTPSISNVLGAAAPVVTDQLVVFAYGSGDVQGAFRQGGLRLWDSAVTGQRRQDAAGKIMDITGDPVLAEGRLFVGTSSGRMVALNPGNGERIWTAQEGTLNPVWVAGGSVFMISDRNQLMRLDAATGARIWAVDLPRFTTDRPRRMVELYAHYGPVLAGGRIVVASGDGALRFFDPASGALTHEVAVPGGATSAPVVAGGVLYVVSRRGQLHAFR